MNSWGRKKDAEIIIQRACEIRRINLGEDHPIYASSLNNLAKLNKLMGNYPAAELRYRKATDILCRLWARKISFTPRCFHNLAMLYKCSENLKRCGAIYTWIALKTCRAVLGVVSTSTMPRL